MKKIITFILIILAIIIISGCSHELDNTNPTDDLNYTKFCGGINGDLCDLGYICESDGDYPDAGGKCVKDTSYVQENELCNGLENYECDAGQECVTDNENPQFGGICIVTEETKIQTPCTKEYIPVCGIDNTTYGNACMAGDVKIAYTGECDDISVQIANPASVYCIENNGVLKIVHGENGEYGICYFNDGSSCEEWDLFRGDCNKGDSLDDTIRACTMEYAPVCGIDNITYGNACMAGDVKIAYTGECEN